MKIQDVPQDFDPSYEGKTKLCYATNEQGKIVGVQTRGWEVESAVKGYAWEVINNELSEIRERLAKKEVSPLFYFMRARQMDYKLLAQNMNMFAFRVRWHSRPKVFNRLNDQWLKKYSDCLEISVERLKNGI
jgi:hypothetical protein